MRRVLLYCYMNNISIISKIGEGKAIEHLIVSDISLSANYTVPTFFLSYNRCSLFEHVLCIEKKLLSQLKHFIR